ncbi:MAG: hypothetical protein ACYCZ6_11430 [Polaromonas sp.]
MLIKKTLVALGVAGTVLFSGTSIWAQAATSTAGDKLASTYSSFAGSPVNAQALVSGLRTSSAITLSASPTGPNPNAPSATVSPATGKMGYGNINIALALSQTALTQQGITSPTPAQLASALSGVLGQRAQGMGWGQIAQSMGVKLGDIVSASKTDKRGKKADHTAKAENVAKADHTSKAQASGKEAGSNGKSGNAGNGSGNAGGNGNGGGGGKK